MQKSSLPTFLQITENVLFMLVLQMIALVISENKNQKSFRNLLHLTEVCTMQTFMKDNYRSVP